MRSRRKIIRESICFELKRMRTLNARGMHCRVMKEELSEQIGLDIGRVFRPKCAI